VQSLVGTPFNNSAFNASGNPSSVVDNSSVGTVAWTNPGNVSVVDGTFATATVTNTSAQTTHYIVATGMGFSIPANATIAGITVEWDRKVNTASNTADNAVRLVKAGSIETTDRSSGSTWQTGLNYIQYGGTSDLWGDTWTPSDINSAGFGAAISAKTTSAVNRTFSIDWVRITVYYTTPDIYNADWTEGIDASDSGKYKISNATSVASGTAVTVDTSGHVGIGTTAPGQALSVAGTIESTTGGIKFPDQTIQTSASGVAQAWVNFDGTTGAIRKAYNVSSVTVNATGDYTLTFTNQMPDANYMVAGSASGLATYTGVQCTFILAVHYTGTSPTLKTTSQLEVIVSNNNSDAAENASEVDVVIHD
jgi:hypothetical protein